jgi:hypothetical protein
LYLVLKDVLGCGNIWCIEKLRNKSVLKVLEIGVAKYLKFLEDIYGIANLDGFEIRTTGLPSPEIRVYRSKIQKDYSANCGSDEYIFKDNPNGGYVVIWTSSMGEQKNISQMFEEYIVREMSITLDNIEELSYEM